MNDGLGQREHDLPVPSPREAGIVNRRRMYVFVAITVATIGLAAFFLTRNTRQELRADTAAAPGYDGSERSVDDAPFQLAMPVTTAGPTTIPGGMPSPYDETTTTETPPASVADPAATPAGPSTTKPGAPQTPPTTAPPRVRLPPLSDPGPGATPTCSAYYLIMQAGRDTQNRFIENPMTKISAIRNLLLQRFDQALSLLDSAPTTPGPDLDVQQTLRGRIAQMRSFASDTTTVQQGALVYSPLEKPRRAGEAVGWPEILDHINRNCIEVYRNAGSTRGSAV